jgi:hypothetical protein
LLIAYDHQQPATRADTAPVVTATAAIDRIGSDAVWLGDGPQHVRQMSRQLGVVAEDLVPPHLSRDDNVDAMRIFGRSDCTLCHRGRVSDAAFCQTRVAKAGA